MKHRMLTKIKLYKYNFCVYRVLTKRIKFKENKKALMIDIIWSYNVCKSMTRPSTTIVIVLYFLISSKKIWFNLNHLGETIFICLLCLRVSVFLYVRNSHIDARYGPTKKKIKDMIPLAKSKKKTEFYLFCFLIQVIDHFLLIVNNSVLFWRVTVGWPEKVNPFSFCI